MMIQINTANYANVTTHPMIVPNIPNPAKPSYLRSKLPAQTKMHAITQSNKQGPNDRTSLIVPAVGLSK
jgi:hypothetical protein